MAKGNDIVRFTDLLRKAFEEPAAREKEEPREEHPGGENESFRLRDLDALREKNRLPAEKERPAVSGSDEAAAETTLKSHLGLNLKGLAFLKRKEPASAPASVAEKDSSLAESLPAGEKVRASEMILKGKNVSRRQDGMSSADAKHETEREEIPASQDAVPETGPAGPDPDPEAVKEEAGEPLPLQSGEKEESDMREQAEQSSAPGIAEEEEGAASEQEEGAGRERRMGMQEPPVDADTLYDALLDHLRIVRRRVIAKEPLDIRPALTLVAKVIQSPGWIRDIYPLTMGEIVAEDYNIPHSANVMIYALKLGVGLGYAKGKLLELGISALFHDVGMFRVPESIARKSGKLSEVEIGIIKTHPDLGRSILEPFRGNYPSLSAVAYEHHEREGGQGYPRGIQGNDIHEFARVVGLVDSYEAMTHNRPYRKALMQSFSARELIKSKHSLYSPQVIRVFLTEISLYPLGSYVRLNNKAVGEVIATDNSHPLRPDVRILYDGEGNKVIGDVIIKLDQNPLFFIVDGVAQGEITNR